MISQWLGRVEFWITVIQIALSWMPYGQDRGLIVNSIERAMLYGLFVVTVAAGLGSYVVYVDYVRPGLERFQRLEEILNKLPRPFREEGDLHAGKKCRCGCDKPGCLCPIDEVFGQTYDENCPALEGETF